MADELGQDTRAQFFREGYLRMQGALDTETTRRVQAAAARLRTDYPNGFDHSNGFGASTMKPREHYPKTSDRAPTVIYHNAGFLEPDLLLPLHDKLVYNTIESVVGRDFYLSNVWVQVVPPGTGRMAYHKDEHGSVSITIPLDEIEWDSGSTCLVPGSHVNTPPPNFCMRDESKQHPREAQLMGVPGDIIFFTPETWHGRAANLTDKPTCRLFLNFYSRASRGATRWSPGVSAELVARTAATLPAFCQHMFRLTPAQAPTASKFSNWVLHNGSSSAETEPSALMREFFYWRHAQRHPLPANATNADLPPFRTTITENKAFSTAAYLAHVNLPRTMKNLARASLAGARSLLGKSGPAARKGGGD